MDEQWQRCIPAASAARVRTATPTYSAITITALRLISPKVLPREGKLGVAGSPIGRDDVTDLGVGAVRGIEPVAAADETLQLCLEVGEFTLPRADVI